MELVSANPYRLDTPAAISFSGGRTSGYMLWHIIDDYGGKLPEGIKVVFCNTGKERPETLDFVERCSIEWDVEITWLEYCNVLKNRPLEKSRNGRTESAYEHTFRVVNYTTASRNGEPLEAVIKARNMLPNVMARFCTVECKIRTTRRYLKSLGWDQWTNAIGFRADEPQRVARLKTTNRHNNEEPVAPLHSAGVGEREVLAWWNSQPFDLQLKSHEGNCDLCLAGETEVVTSKGIVPIRDLAGTTTELLVPKIANGSLSEVGKFQPAHVRSFGVQKLWRIELAGHGRATKEVFATAEHRWFLTTKKGQASLRKGEVKTSDLKPGDRLKNLFRCPIGEHRGGASKLGAMHGFVWGDGSVPYEDRPGTIRIHEGKDEVFLTMFSTCCGEPTEDRTEYGVRFWTYYGIPKAWKIDPVDLGESRHYLMGWLSGWFAADGCVDENGTCVLNSANREHLMFARSVCAVLGIQCSQVRYQDRTVTPPGGLEREHRIYVLNINRNHLTADFFWLAHHRERAQQASTKQVRRYGWTVKSVEPTPRIEEVFCATVEGVGAFGLADGLMTGNCFLKGQGKIQSILRDRPDLAEWWIRMEQSAEDRGLARNPSVAFFRKDRPRYTVQLELAQRPGLFDEIEQDELSIACHCTD
jgi:3'-phosphoadenosine 5'-phosphosulfate sulfotransferase (PAPS reductase)/FAD synthetase